jgi:hypothetical protein
MGRLIIFNKELQGKRTPEDPEPSTVMFLVLLLRNCKEKDAGGSGASGLDFLLAFYTEM